MVAPSQALTKTGQYQSSILISCILATLIDNPFQMNLVYLKLQDAICTMLVDAQLSRLSSVFDSCFLCSIVFPWSKDSQCRNYGGKGEVVFVVAMN